MIYLPVSVGEAFDKFSILEIKYERITDIRKKEVKKELDFLKEKINIKENLDLYKKLKNINEIIWNQMDKLNDSKLEENEYFKLCKDCIENNNLRYKIKNEINIKTNSEIKEQKSYKEYS